MEDINMFKVVQVDNMGLIAYNPDDVKDTGDTIKSDSFIMIFVKEISSQQWSQMPLEMKNSNLFYKLKEENGVISILFFNKMNDNVLIEKDSELVIHKKYIIASYTMNPEIEKWIRSKLSNIVIAQSNSSTSKPENVIKFPG